MGLVLDMPRVQLFLLNQSSIDIKSQGLLAQKLTFIEEYENDV